MYVTLQCCIVNLKMDTRHIIVHFMAPRRSTDVMQSQFKSHEILTILNELVYVKVAHHCYHFTSCKCIWSANSTGKADQLTLNGGSEHGWLLSVAVRWYNKMNFSWYASMVGFC